MLVCSCSDDERREIPTPAKPYLNVKDSLALVDIYKQAHGEGWTLVDWDLENIQTWGGVTAALDTVMNEYRVVGFVMQDGSSGILSDKIGDLVELRSLSLYGKGLYGELPKTIGNLVNLESLVVSSTSLSGALPKEIGNLKNIEVMQIYFNEFTEIPKEFGNLPKSGVYMMQHNKFAGEVPETLRFYENSDESSGISGIDLSYNCFTSFPWSFSQMMMIVWYLICGEIGYLEPFQMRYLNLRSGRDGKLKYHVKRKDMDILITRRKKMSIEKSLKKTV